MIRSERDETLSTSTSTATRESGVSLNACAARAPRRIYLRPGTLASHTLRRRVAGGVVRRIVVTLLCFVMTFQPGYVLAGNIVAAESRQNTSHAQSGNAAPMRSLAVVAGGVLSYLSSLFGSNGSPASAEPFTPTPVPPITDAAVSIHHPSFSSGRIEGSLRVFSSENFSYGSPFTQTGDIYVVGTPTIKLNSGASYAGLVDDGGAATPSGYTITLNSNVILPGRIHQHADPVALPAVPTAVPAPAGTRTVSIASPSDVSLIGNWATVKDLKVSASGVVIEVPPGNYGAFTVSGKSQLNFSPGTYNFAGTISLGNTSIIQTTGNITINIAPSVNISSGSFVPGPNTLPGDVVVNCLGTAFSLNSASQLTGLLRAPNATVNLTGTSVVHGQVIANYLSMSGGKIIGDTSATPPPDTTPPSVVITSPEDNSTTTASSITVAGTALDTGANATNIAHVYVNDAEAAYDTATGQWTPANVALALGANTITARAIDHAGNQASVSVTVTRQLPVDNVAPTISITSPANNSTTAADNVTVSGTVSDSGTPVSGVARVLVNGAPATLDPAGTWTLSGVALSVGSNTITATAYDNANNQSSASIVVTRQQPPDTQAPQVSITSPANNSTTTETFVNVSGTASDAGQYQSGVSQVTVNGIAATYDAASGQWTAANVPVTLGANTITATATDGAGNHSDASITVTRQEPPDTAPPNLSVSEPADNSTTDSETTTVSGSVSDTGTNASGVAGVTVNGTPAQLNAQTGSWTLAGVALALGQNTINVRATDRAGNEAVTLVHVTRVLPPDTQPPTVQIQSPADGSTVPDETITVNGTASDEGVNAAGVRTVTVNGVVAGYDATTHQWSATGVALHEGANTITVVAIDAAPAANSREATIIVTRRTPDRDAPTIVITSPAFGFETYDAAIDVAGTASDDGLNATGVSHITVNGRAAIYDATTKQWTISNVALAYGDNTIVAVATDGASPAHEGSATLHVTRQRIPPPSLTLTNPQNGGVYSSSTITVAGNVSSLSTEPIAVTVNGASSVVTGGSFTKTVALVEGSNTINVVATDALGQQAQSSVTVLRDQTAPTVSFVSPPQSVQPGASYQITVEATDNVGVAEVEFSVNGSHVASDAEAPYVFTLNVPAVLAAGNTLTLSAVARDLSGTSATATAQARTTGPGGISGYVFDDATGYTLENAQAAIAGETAATTDAAGTFGLVSNNPTGVVRLSKDGYTAVERIYTVTPSEGTALFDARLTPLDEHANQIGAAGGTATGDAGRLRLDIAAGVLQDGTDVRLTSVSPQGLVNLLPYGWSPVPGAVVDVRAGASASTAFQTPAHLRIARTTVSLPNLALALARYDEQTHGWRVVAANLSAGADGSLEADLLSAGQYAFLVADQGVTAPPPAQGGQMLSSSSPADSSALDAATAYAVSTPRVATYSAQARSTISFVASAPTQLPSGVVIEASYGETYNLLGGKDSVFVERPQQDFVLYAFPSVSADQPNRLGASFIAKPTRTDFSITDLLGANVHVEIRSGRQAKTGVLVGPTGGTVRAGDGATLQIAPDSFNSPQPVFFESASVDMAGLSLPEGYEVIAVFDVNLSGGSLSRGATISLPVPVGDNSRVVAARVISVGGRVPKVVARALETGGRLATTTAAPSVPSGVYLQGIVSSGRYVFIRVPRAFGYVSGSVTDGASGGAVASAKVYDNQTPFVDVTGANGRYTLVGVAGDGDAGANQIGAESLQTDATGHAAASLTAQDAVATANISLASVALRVESVSPADNATNMVVTTPVTVTFNKPITPSTLTASTFKLTTANNNPVLGTITVLAGNRVAVITPQATLAASTRYIVTVAQSVRDVYGHTLEAAFSSSFTTADPITIGNRLRPEQIRINYPDETGMSSITIPAHSVPEGTTIMAVNTSSGATVTTVAGVSDITLQIPASVGDEISVTIRQPDGTEYVVSQGAYRRADGFTSVGANGGTIVGSDGATVLSVPPGAIKGVADIKMTPKGEDTIPIPRAHGLEEPNTHFGGAVEIKTEGNFTCERELHIEMPAPANAQEGQLVAFLKPTKVKDESGQMVDVWESITSGRVTNGKMKSNSPPFVGVFISSFAIIEIWALMPSRARVVFGYVREFQPDPNKPELPVFGATVLAGSYETGWYGRMVGRTQYPFGRFSMFEFGFAPNDENAVPLKVYDDLHNRQATGIALTSGTFEEDFFEGLAGWASFRGIVLMPLIPNNPITDPPPGITVFARSNNGPQEQDTLYTRGIATVGSGAVIVVRSDKPLAQISGTVLVGGTTTRQLTWHEVTDAGGGLVHFYTAPVEVTAEGSYFVTVRGSSRANDIAATTTVTYNFVGLRNPNTRPPLPGPPSVIHITPGDGADNVELTTDIRIDFSEPVHNLVAGQTVYVQEDGQADRIGGAIISGGITVQPDTPNISSIIFKPTGALAGGKKYTVHVTSEVVDDTNVGLDQQYTGDGDLSKEFFSSSFTTFSGLVLTETPIPETSTRIKVVGQYAYTIKPLTSNNLVSRLTVYDVADPQKPVVRGTLNIPQRAFDLSVTESEEDAFNVEGRVHTRIAAVVTAAPQFPEQHANVWFVNLDDVTAPELVGVTSLYLPLGLPSNPLSVEIHKGRAYIGSTPYRGVSVVDMARSVKLWVQGQRAGKNPVLEAVRPPISTTGNIETGFGTAAKIQTVTTEQAPTLGAFLAAPSISVLDQLAGSDKIPVGQMPIVYVANNTYLRLIEIAFPRIRDGRHGFNVYAGELDDRIFALKPVDPKTATPMMVKTIQDVFVGTSRVDLALLLGANRLWIFDATTPGHPVQYASKSFDEMGIQGSARYFDVEGTLAYVVVDNDIVVIDFSDPTNPHQAVRLTGVGSNLRSLAVKDGFIYSLSTGTGAQDGLNVSIALPTSRLFVSGATADPATTCAGPVVIDRATHVMRQAASIYFQVFGHQAPAAQSVVIRKGENIIATVPATLLPSSNERVTLGHAEWNSGEQIDRTAEYTAELVFDQNAASEFHSLREPIPFSFLIENYAEQMTLTIKGATAQADEKATFGYVIGSPANVTLTVNGNNVLTDTRGFGINIEQLPVAGLAEGRYPFTFRAEMIGNAAVSDQVNGILVVRRDGDDARPPGHTVVSGVDIASGNLGVSQADIPEIKNRGISLSLVRSYNSAGANTFTPFGYGWQHNFNVLLTFKRSETGGGTYQLRGGDGSGQTFKAGTPTGFLVMQAEKPYHGTLYRNADGSFDYYTTAHVRHHFPGALELNSYNFYDQSYMGNLEYIQEPNGNKLTLDYDPQGRMTSVTDSSLRTLEFTYESAPSPFAGVVAATNATRSAQSCVPRGQFSLLRTRFVKAQLGQAWRIKQVKGPGGLVINYDYDADGNLVKATRQGTDDISASTVNAVWEYAYKPAATSSTVQLTHLIKSATNPNGHTTAYDYWFDKLGAPTKSVARNEGVSNNFTYTFDGSNRITSASVADARGNQTVYTQSTDGYTTAIDAPRGAHTEFAFNSEGQKTREVDPLGTVTTYEYDAKGNLKKTTHTGTGASITTDTIYDQTFSKPVFQRDADGNATEFTLDSHGNVTRIKLPTGASQSFDYGSNGDLSNVTDERGLTTVFTYDRYGNPRTVTRETVSGSNVVAEYTFDARSRMTGVSDTARPGITRTFDALDRIVAQTDTDPAGFRDALSKSYTYNAGGMILTASLSGGGQSLNQTYTYDALERVTRIEETANGVAASLARTFTYDANSNVTSQTDRRGVTTTYEYDALNFRTSERLAGPFGADVQLTTTAPDLVGNSISKTDRFNQQTTYTYDGLHRLRSRTLPGSYIEEQTLDGNGNVVSSKDRNGRVTTTAYDPLDRPKEQHDPAGRTHTWTYNDATGAVTQVWSPQNLTVVDQRDALGRSVRHEVAFDNADYVTTHAYAGRLRVTVDARGTSYHEDLSAFGEVGNFVVQAGSQMVRTESRYGAFGGLKSMKDANERTSLFTRDGLNRAIAASYPEGFNESWVYDGEGLMLSHTDIRGVASAMSYDNQRRGLTTTVNDADGSIHVLAINYDDNAHKQTRTDANNHSTVLSYDGLGRLISLKNADNRTSTYEYDGMNLRREGDFKGASSEYQYDPVDRVVEVKDRAGQVTTVAYNDAGGYTRTTTDRRGFKSIEASDPLGRLESVTEGGQPLVSYEYDGNNNRTAVVDGRNNRSVYEFDAINRLRTCNHAGLQTESYGYDAAGNLTSYNDGRGRDALMEYDGLNHLKKRTDGAGNVSTFKYDGAGLLLEKTAPKGGTYKTSFEYNALGSLKTVTDANSGIWSFTYDGKQNLKSATDARHNAVSYDYDALDRLTTIRQPLSLTTTYGYDANSNRTSILDAKGQQFTLTYDELDRLKSNEFRNDAQNLTDRFDYTYDPEADLTGVRQTRADGAEVQVKQYALSYDARRRLQSATDEFGKSVSYEYDAANNLTRLVDAAARQSTYVYDAHNRLQSASLAGGRTANFEWYADGHLKHVGYGGGLQRDYAYDDADRVSRIANTVAYNGVTSQRDEFTYTYDANSNVESETRTTNNTPTRTGHYFYDHLDRLTQAEYLTPGGTPEGNTLTWTYDAAGNRESESGTAPNGAPVGRTYQYDALNRLTQMTDSTTAYHYEYDNNGNLLATRAGGGQLVGRYEYDARDQMRVVKDGQDQELARYDYDYARRRTLKSFTGGAEQRFTYDGLNVLDEFDKRGQLVNRYDYGAGLLRGEFANEGERFYFADAIGSTSSLSQITQSGDVQTSSTTASYYYDAWGGITAAAGASVNQLGYTGQRRDAETGWMALGSGARYYAPGFGRFTQQDSWTGIASAGQSLNRYAYTYGNPLRYIDPTGHRGTQFDPPDYNFSGLEALTYFLSGLGNAAWEFVTLPIDLGIAIEGRLFYGLEAEDMPFLSKTAQGERDAFLAGESRSDISARAVKQLVFSEITFGVGPEIVNQLQLVQKYANGEISTADYDAASMKSLGGFGFNVALVAVSAGAGRGRAGVIEEGASEAAARRSPLRDTLGRVGERVGEFGSRAGERLSRLNERISEGLDAYAERSHENMMRAIQKGRRSELGVLGEIPKAETTTPGVESYGELRSFIRRNRLGEQANHLNQDAAFGDVIPKNEGAAVGMRGNAFTEPGTPHYEFHRSLEGFWDQYRTGGEFEGLRPTNAEYGQALQRALQEGGFSEEQAARISEAARQNREAYGLGQNDPVPRVPNPLRQRRP